MRKLALIVAAAAAVAAVTPALAQDVSLRVGSGYHHRGAVHERIVVRHDRGYHRGWDRGHHYGWRHSHNNHPHARVVIR
jgi:opacity protein-like surface antigen